jgi:hypothetical protein
MQEAKRGNQNAAFWERPDVEAVRRAIDIWASCIHHRRHGCEGVPNLDWLDDADAFVMKLVKTGRGFNKVEVFTGDDEEFGKLKAAGMAFRREVSEPSREKETVGDGDLPYVRVCELMVHDALRAVGNPRIMEDLLLHMYPRRGPYAGSSATYRGFRPELWVKVTVGRLPENNRHVQRKIDELWQQMEREFIQKCLSQRVMRTVKRGNAFTEAAEVLAKHVIGARQENEHLFSKL